MTATLDQVDQRPDEVLQEYCAAHTPSVRVDRAAGVIRSVKILGLNSRNGRRYEPEALRAAVALYDGAKVNLNHPKGSPVGPRDYQDRIGAIRDVQLRSGEGLFADFHFNPKHALAEQLAWDAEHSPGNVGFSHNVTARTTRRDGQTVIEAITRVQSVDLVADPGTTRGLFEQGSGGDDSRQEPESTPSTLAEQLAGLREEVRQLREQLADVRRGEGVAPQSREQALVEGIFRPQDVASFVRAIT